MKTFKSTLTDQEIAAVYGSTGCDGYTFSPEAYRAIADAAAHKAIENFLYLINHHKGGQCQEIGDIFDLLRDLELEIKEWTI
jgi:hypothetical protein